MRFGNALQEEHHGVPDQGQSEQPGEMETHLANTLVAVPVRNGASDITELCFRSRVGVLCVGGERFVTAGRVGGEVLDEWEVNRREVATANNGRYLGREGVGGEGWGGQAGGGAGFETGQRGHRSNKHKGPRRVRHRADQHELEHTCNNVVSHYTHVSQEN